MKNKIELYALGGCGTCGRIKYALQAEEIEYELVDCTQSDNKKCDSLEDKVDCGRYPMAVIKAKGSTTVIHFCDNKPAGGTNTKRIPVDSEDKFIQEVKKAYI